MSKVKVVIVAVFAAAALSVVTAGTASADWFVNGTKLTTLTKLATTAKVDENAVLNLPGPKIKLECTATVLKGTAPEILPVDKGQANSLVFEGCKVTEPASGCTLSSSEIPTQPITATATLKSGSSTEDRVLFTPKTKTQFATIPFSEANTCALAGEQPVKGQVIIGAPTGQTEEPAQAIVGLGSTENNSLEVGAGNKAFIEKGKALVTLESGLKWSFK